MGIKQKKIGRRKKVSFYVLSCPQKSDRGCNMAVEVYELNWKTGWLEIIGADYAINTASWKGDKGCGISVIASVYADLKHDGYRISDHRVINYQSL